MRVWAIAVAAALGVLLSVAQVLAAPKVYVYSVMHPTYGHIGTLTDTVDHSPNGMRIDSQLHIAVKLVGIVIYRQDSDITEIMNGGKLISLESVTDKDGQHLEVHGKAEFGGFAVNATGGSFTGPATTAPSSPWLLKQTGRGTLVYPSTGRIRDAQVSGGELVTISLDGAPVSVRHFIVTGLNREDVWLDSAGIPVMFRSFEDGTPIDFVLQNALGAAAAASLGAKTISAPPPSGSRNN
jgi:Family of unknown function (DUF6134)